ncbi:DUF1800 family protein [Uliginosibacterium sp. sgz301328]|uniref:DUF1800 domain-containing protein n=1 Tax=Uliginosibacterium sp. sgz301328 TaxID=3243764 RepID=UPI00359D3CEA
MRHSIKHALAVSLVLALLSACGGGGGGGTSGGSSSQSSQANQSSQPGQSGSSSSSGSQGEDSPVAIPTSSLDAARLLSQATFGADEASIDDIAANGPASWITRQFAIAPSSHRAYVDNIKSQLASGATLQQKDFLESFWTQAAAGQDQLRQRVALALSEIFVVSFQSSVSVRSIASYYDVLGRNAFGNFRTLLQDVTLHPAMGQYLTYLRNQKENGAGRVPDENYAREVMQLFTIGLYQLNPDGSPVLRDGKPIETYTNSDVSGLAKVFTGWSWGGPDNSDNRWVGNSLAQDPDRDVIPMQAYPKYHSVSEKRFLSATIPQMSGTPSVADVNSDLNVALDALFNHPNAGPFFARQLIQRLVTSNPSPAYISRVATAFANNGQGVRGDMKAVIRAVLLDPEARDATTAQGPGYGKLREPIVRLGNWLRAFHATPPSGRYQVGSTDSTLGQTPMNSSSVFNFFRPGYVPSNTQVASLGLVAPEMQISNESTVAIYINSMQTYVQGYVGPSLDRAAPDYSKELALADQPGALVDRLNLLLTAGNMKTSTRSRIIAAISDINLRTNTATNNATDRRNRVLLAVLLTMASTDYIVQK